MRVIWKFHIQGPDTNFDAPAGARAVSVQLQSGSPSLWLLCERDSPKAKHRVRCFATGQSIPEDAGDFVGTLQFENGRLILHVFHRQLGITLS